MTSALEEQVILVEADDRPTGTMGKLEAHRRGALHRALSVFGFDAQGRLLLQQRAPGKYHSGGLWTNTCCSHPRAGEDTAAAAGRRPATLRRWLLELHALLVRASRLSSRQTFSTCCRCAAPRCSPSFWASFGCGWAARAAASRAP